MGGGAAFFDVDGTLMYGLSIANFIEHFKDSPAERGVIRPLLELQANLVRYPDPFSRQQAFFEAMAGQDWNHMLELGEEWFSHSGRRQMIESTCVRALEHKLAGDNLVLVSGSWMPCLLPIMRWIGADEVFGSEPELHDGLMTGGARVIMVGEAKADVVLRFSRRHGLDPLGCAAYGDDISDLPMLEAVGRPAVVGAGAELAALSRERGWEELGLGSAGS